MSVSFRDAARYLVFNMIGRIRLVREWRWTVIWVAFSIWFGCLFGAIAVQQEARRLAAGPVVNATVRSTWVEHVRGPTPYARLVFDRKRPDGQTAHCNVAVKVSESGRTLSPGDTIRIVPSPDECWEPDVICETCAPVTPRQIAMMYVASALSGLLFIFLIWRGIRELQRNGVVPQRLPDLSRS